MKFILFTLVVLFSTRLVAQIPEQTPLLNGGQNAAAAAL